MCGLSSNGAQLRLATAETRRRQDGMQISVPAQVAHQAQPGVDAVAMPSEMIVKYYSDPKYACSHVNRLAS
jgi:hypothetical protein